MSCRSLLAPVKLKLGKLFGEVNKLKRNAIEGSGRSHFKRLHGRKPVGNDPERVGGRLACPKETMRTNDQKPRSGCVNTPAVGPQRDGEVPGTRTAAGRPSRVPNTRGRCPDLSVRFLTQLFQVRLEVLAGFQDPGSQEGLHRDGQLLGRGPGHREPESRRPPSATRVLI